MGKNVGAANFQGSGAGDVGSDQQYTAACNIYLRGVLLTRLAVQMKSPNSESSRLAALAVTWKTIRPPPVSGGVHSNRQRAVCFHGNLRVG